MTTVEINKTRYQIRDSWHEYTLEQAGRIEAIEPPERFLKLLKGEITDADITYIEQVKTFPKYFGDVLCACSDIPVEVMQYVSHSERTILYTYVKSIVYDILMRSGISYDYQNLTCIEHEGNVYELPKNETIAGMLNPMIDFTAVDFAESSDLLVILNDSKQSLCKNGALLCALMLRDRSKPYNESEVLKLSERFVTLSMASFWEVFFSLNVATLILLGFTLQSLINQIQAEKAAQEQPI